MLTSIDLISILERALDNAYHNILDPKEKQYIRLEKKHLNTLAEQVQNELTRVSQKMKNRVPDLHKLAGIILVVLTRSSSHLSFPEHIAHGDIWKNKATVLMAKACYLMILQCNPADILNNIRIDSHLNFMIWELRMIDKKDQEFLLAPFYFSFLGFYLENMFPLTR